VSSIESAANPSLYARWESPHRYYVVKVHEDIFGEWVISVARGGRRNNLGATFTKPVGSKEAGERAVGRIDVVRRRRGYVRVL
jgi:hypothetical protein